MAQGKGIPTMQQSGGGYPAAHVAAAMKSMGAGKPVSIKSRDYTYSTPTYCNTALTHQGVTVRSGR